MLKFVPLNPNAIHAIAIAIPNAIQI